MRALLVLCTSSNLAMYFIRPFLRRPIEVLLKHEHQTTAVDIWAAGVILLCMLSRAYPFFRAPDDMTALAEVTTLFGTNNVRMAAKSYGKNFIWYVEKRN